MKYECGCKTFIDPMRASLGYQIDYCPKHKAAPALYEALKELRVFYETGNMDFQKVRLDVLSALSKAEGK